MTGLQGLRPQAAENATQEDAEPAGDFKQRLLDWISKQKDVPPGQIVVTPISDPMLQHVPQDSVEPAEAQIAEAAQAIRAAIPPGTKPGQKIALKDPAHPMASMTLIVAKDGTIDVHNMRSLTALGARPLLNIKRDGSVLLRGEMPPMALTDRGYRERYHLATTCAALAAKSRQPLRSPAKRRP